MKKFFLRFFNPRKREKPSCAMNISGDVKIEGSIIFTPDRKDPENTIEMVFSDKGMRRKV